MRWSTYANTSLVSIPFISPASREQGGWRGVLRPSGVSIPFISPASREQYLEGVGWCPNLVSIPFISPASREHGILVLVVDGRKVSIPFISPASRELTQPKPKTKEKKGFQSLSSRRRAGNFYKTWSRGAAERFQSLSSRRRAGNPTERGGGYFLLLDVSIPFISPASREPKQGKMVSFS